MRLFRRKKFVYGALACSFLACLPWVPVLAAEPGWAKQEDGWYFYMEDGSPAGDGWRAAGRPIIFWRAGRCLQGA